MTQGSDDDGINDSWRQSPFTVRLDWGSSGAQAIARKADVAIVVDVLSFSTAVSVAADRGATVFPFRWSGRSEEASTFAKELGAVLASRRSAMTAGGVSLSPASIREVERLDRLVLPSPNGSTISANLQDLGCIVVAACLRNRRAVAEWLTSLQARRGSLSVAIIAAGERWPDGGLRPAVEDWWGAGALVALLVEQGWHNLSAEALAASSSFAAVGQVISAALRSCASGQELIAAGWPADVEIAGEIDASDSVPVLMDGRFIDASTNHGSDIRPTGIH